MNVLIATERTSSRIVAESAISPPQRHIVVIGGCCGPSGSGRRLPDVPGGNKPIEKNHTDYKYTSEGRTFAYDHATLNIRELVRSRKSNAEYTRTRQISQVKRTRTRQISQVKQRRAWSVLGSETAWESQVS
uniref:Uncharacterized protein n=1 Tax=Steinernema glaseri TaxID=37863 RepID=A0A1I7Y8F9_9BILA